MNQSRLPDTRAYRNSVAERIGKRERELMALKSQHNTVTPICRLPPEVLSDIFVLVAKESSFKFPGQPQLHITHICRHWRAVAIDCSALWVDLPLVNAEYTATVIPRSKSVTLSINMQGDELVKRFKGALYPVLPQSHRLRSVALNIPWNSRETLRDILVGFSSSAPMLETLELVCDGFDGDGFPPGFLINGAPRLKELDLSRCGMRWTDIPICSTLTSLSLFEAKIPHATSLRRPSVHAFLNALKQLGQLQSLAMYGFLPATGMREMSNEHLHPRVSLPSLSSLILVDFHLSISYFFQTTHLPIASSIELNFVDEIPAAAILGDILTEIPAAWVTGEKGKSPMQQDIGELRVWDFDEQSHNSGQKVVLHFQDPSNISAYLELSFYHRNLPTQDIIIEIRRNANFTSSLNSLDLTNVGSFDEAFWASTFGSCSALNKIIFDRCESVDTFIDAVTNNLTSMADSHGDPGAPTGTTPSTLLFPSLDTIELILVGIGDWVKLDQPVNALTRLGKMLKTRSISTHPIRVLHFDSSDAVSREDIRELRDQVGPGVKMFSDGLSI